MDQLDQLGCAVAAEKGVVYSPGGWGVRGGRASRQQRSRLRPRVDFEQVKSQYIAWGKMQGGRGGRPWSKVHAKHRLRYLEYWASTLDLQYVDQLDGCLTKVEAFLSRLQNIGDETLTKSGEEKKKNSAPKPLSGKTLANFSDGLKSFCDFCVKRGYLADDPLRELGRFDTTPKIQRRSLTREEISVLLDSCPSADRRLVYETALSSGLRVNELRSLNKKDLDVVNGGLKLRPEWTKNRKPGFQPLPLWLVQKLSAQDRANGTLLKVTRHPARYFKADLKRAKIDPTDNGDGKLDFHALRVTFTTMVVDCGASVKEAQAMARHSTPNLTMNTYARAASKRLSYLAESIGERFKPARSEVVEVMGVEPTTSLPHNNLISNEKWSSNSDSSAATTASATEVQPPGSGRQQSCQGACRTPAPVSVTGPVVGSTSKFCPTETKLPATGPDLRPMPEILARADSLMRSLASLAPSRAADPLVAEARACLSDLLYLTKGGAE